jgi:hypothetical protein
MRVRDLLQNVHLEEQDVDGSIEMIWIVGI